MGMNTAVMANYNNTVGYSGFETMPDGKYYDLYTFDDINSCTLTTCGGHALNEIAPFVSYEDREHLRFVNNEKPWLARHLYGFYSSSGGSSGNTGYEVYVGFRSVIASSYNPNYDNPINSGEVY